LPKTAEVSEDSVSAAVGVATGAGLGTSHGPGERVQAATFGGVTLRKYGQIQPLGSGEGVHPLVGGGLSLGHVGEGEASTVGDASAVTWDDGLGVARSEAVHAAARSRTASNMPTTRRPESTLDLMTPLLDGTEPSG
jgi:hypothetical protein